MTAIARELEEKLKTLDARTADSLERLVRDALALIDSQNGTAGAAQPHRLPPDFFKRVAEEFGSEPFERPPQGESEQREAW
jgi:hypothetical protein